MSPGIIIVDIHGLTKYQAKQYLDNELKKADKSVYRIRVVHGYHNGTELMNMVRKEYKNKPKVVRIELGLNQGETDLVLREFK